MTSTFELNGLYQVKGQWKVVHPTRANGRIGKSKVKNVATSRDGPKYAQQYATAN